MKDQSRTKQELLKENAFLKQKIQELEHSESERKHAEEALRRSEENFRHSLDDLPLGVRIATEEGGTIYANRAVLDIYSLDELKATPPIKCYTPECYTEFQIRRKKRKRGDNAPSEYELRIIGKDGEIRHLQVFRKEILWDGERQFQVIYNDITARKQAELAMRRSEENFRHSLDDSPMGVRIVTVKGEIIYTNRAILNIYGFDSMEDFNAIPAEKRYTPESYADFLIRREKRRQGIDIPSEYTINIIRKDGGVRFLNVLRSEILWDGERQFLVIYNDITERKRVEDALRHSEVFLNSIIEHSPHAMWISDDKGTLIRLNQACRDLLHISDDEVVGKYNVLQDNIVEEQGFLSLVKQVFEKGETVKLNLKYDSSQIKHLELGETASVILDVTISPVSDKNGRVTNAIIQHMNITELKRGEEKIKASLREKETMLKEIHHRVKNNLQVISSLLNLQSSYLQDDRAKEALRESIERLETMAFIHTQLYESQDLARVDFGSFIRDLIGNIRQSYLRTEFPVEIHVDAGEISLGIDNSIPCGLILNELVTNALKHAFPEGKEREINIRMRLDDNQVMLTVQDNGIGFPESIDFTDVKSLGLDLVNILVRQMHGKIDMLVDGGTMWTITFTVKNEKEWPNG